MVSGGSEPPRSILLYYIDSHKRVISEYDRDPFGCIVDVALYIIPILAACAVMKLMGYNFEN